MKRSMPTSFALFVMLAACACGGQPASQPHSNSTTAASEPEPREPEAPAEADCAGKTCAPPEQCIRYFGVAGPSIPLSTCGIPCGAQGECPDGKRCEAIADGPRSCK
jgi:hypothetical protein